MSLYRFNLLISLRTSPSTKLRVLRGVSYWSSPVSVRKTENPVSISYSRHGVDVYQWDPHEGGPRRAVPLILVTGVSTGGLLFVGFFCGDAINDATIPS